MASREWKSTVVCSRSPRKRCVVWDFNQPQRQRQRKRSGYLYKFAIIPYLSSSTMWPNYPETEQVGSAFSTKPWIWSLHVVILPRTAKKCAKIYNTSARPLFFSLNPIVSWRCRFRRCSSCLNPVTCFAEEGKEMYQNLKRTCRAICFSHLAFHFVT